MNYETLWQRLTDIYETGEAKAIVRLVLEVRFGLTMTDILCGKIEKFTSEEQKDLKHIIQRLETGEPVQYVLGEAEFGGRTFHVEPGVLIPRPETYELCQWIMDDGRWKKEDERNASILDIGTGSGCIACTLAAEMPDTEVTAWDISDEALRIATENAKRTNVHVSFKKVDVLNTPLLYKKGMGMGFDIIVSNPPYICNKEREAMERNVLEHEPALALFVPDDDPLLFYRTIARYAAKVLKPDGALYFEINPIYVNEMQQMLSDEGYSHTEIRNDQFGKQRFTKSCL
jgi:release factor glutamine methyltransferase